MVLEAYAPIMRLLLPTSSISLIVAGKTHVGRHGALEAAGGRTSPVSGSQEVLLPFCMNVCGSAGGGDVDVGLAEIFKRLSATLRGS